MSRRPIAFSAFTVSALAALAWAVCAWAAAAQPAPAPAGPDVDEAGELATLLSDDQVAVGADFAGAKITLFGALPDRRQGDVIIVLKGPELATKVLKRRQTLGLWIAGAPQILTGAPAYFRVLTSRPLKDTTTPGLLRRLDILPDSVSADIISATPAAADSARAFVRLKEASGLYGVDPGAVQSLPGGLFKVDLKIPANAPVGRYEAEVHLFREGRFVSSATSTFTIAKTGFERRLAQWSQRQALLYGLACVLSALGWGAAAATLLRRR